MLGGGSENLNRSSSSLLQVVFIRHKINDHLAGFHSSDVCYCVLLQKKVGIIAYHSLLNLPRGKSLGKNACDIF